MPDVLNQPIISVNTPNGSQNIANPLYNYTFHPLPSSPDFPNVKVGTHFYSNFKSCNNISYMK